MYEELSAPLGVRCRFARISTIAIPTRKSRAITRIPNQIEFELLGCETERPHFEQNACPSDMVLAQAEQNIRTPFELMGEGRSVANGQTFAKENCIVFHLR